MLRGLPRRSVYSRPRVIAPGGGLEETHHATAVRGGGPTDRAFDGSGRRRTGVRASNRGNSMSKIRPEHLPCGRLRFCGRNLAGAGITCETCRHQTGNCGNLASASGAAGATAGADGARLEVNQRRSISDHLTRPSDCLLSHTRGRPYQYINQRLCYWMGLSGTHCPFTFSKNTAGFGNDPGQIK